MSNIKYVNAEKTAVSVDGTCVPRGHYLWAELGVQELEDAGTINPYVPPNTFASDEHQWVLRELANADIQINLHLDGDTRAIATEVEWRTYRKNLRNYTSLQADGTILLSGDKPIQPI